VTGCTPRPLADRAATRRGDWLRLWLPVVAWMVLIFIASADSDSNARGSRILGPLLRWLIPDISPFLLERTIFHVRKLVHFVTFGVLAALLWRALAAAHPGRWSPRTAWTAIGVTALYAVSDELHQSLTPSRVASAWDVVIDTAGAAFTVAAIWRVGRWLRRW
jgi:VanZ family protein